MSDALPGMNPVIALTWASAALCFLLSFHAFVMRRRRGAHLALAGVAVAGLGTLYSHDVMALPQICVALTIGIVAGPMLARKAPVSKLPALLAALSGQAGLASVLIGAAAWRNPHAFGLLDDAGGLLRPDAAGAIGLGVALGAMASGGAITILRRRTAETGAGRQGFRVMALLAATAATALSFAMAPGLGLLCACAGVALLAGRFLAEWALQTGEGPALALIGGLTGWSVAAFAFLLEDMAMAVAGGLAGVAGSLFALRLCGGAGRKGLADVRCRP